MKTFALGDIHGAYKALKQVLERSGFDYENDTLIALGDVADGWSEVPQCIEELLKIKNLIYVMGNHDFWMDEWLEYGLTPIIWTEQGGEATIDAYLKDAKENENPLMIKHRNFFKKSVRYYIDDQNRIFTHGGFERGVDLKQQTPHTFMWDRSLAEKAVNSMHLKTPMSVHEFKEVFLGHTTVNSFPRALPKDLPVFAGNVILLDTGAGYEGKLTIMNVDTKEYFQSDPVAELYPNERGRK